MAMITTGISESLDNMSPEAANIVQYYAREVVQYSTLPRKGNPCRCRCVSWLEVDQVSASVCRAVVEKIQEAGVTVTFVPGLEDREDETDILFTAETLVADLMRKLL